MGDPSTDSACVSIVVINTHDDSESDGWKPLRKALLIGYCLSFADNDSFSDTYKFRDVPNRFFNMSKPPASTLVQVSGLFREDILIEIEATAIIPKN
jgi:hypothetical protein